MTISNPLTRFTRLLALSLLVGVWTISPHLQATEPKGAPQLFTSPDEAVKALKAAVEAKDQTALGELFGPDFQQLFNR